MEANKRAKGIGMEKQPIIKKDHDANEFVMSLTTNDLVQLENAPGKYYRIQKMRDTGQLTLRVHTASTLDIKDEGIVMNIAPLMSKHSMKKILVNSIGKII